MTKKEEAERHKNVNVALSAAQAEIENPPKEKTADTGKYKYKYADISVVLETVLPVLSKHGISVTQAPKILDGQMILETVLTHGESETFVSCEYPVCSINGNHQQMGGALTYARRYALCSMVGVAPAEDLDGADAAKSGNGDMKQMSSQQAKKELNWDAIVNTIRSAKSLERVKDLKAEAIAKKGYWPASFVSSALEEIQTRQEELEYESRVSEAKDDPGSIATMLQECHTVGGVERLRMTLKQIGVETSHIEDEFELRISEISGNVEDLFPEDAS